jgi:hypothetical protein
LRIIGLQALKIGRRDRPSLRESTPPPWSEQRRTSPVPARRAILACLVVALGVFSAKQAPAEPIFSYAFDKPSYTVGLGGTVDVTVFFQEMDNSSSGSLPNGYLAKTGLDGLGVILAYTNQPARVQHIADVTANSAFLIDPTSASSITVTNTQATLLENVGLGPVVTSSSANSPFHVVVGVFRFTGLLVGTATITAEVTGSGADNVGGDGTILDSFTSSQTASIHITGAAVPEPSTWMLLLAGAAILSFHRMGASGKHQVT